MVKTFRKIWLDEPEAASGASLIPLPKLPKKYTEDSFSTLSNVNKLTALIEKESNEFFRFIQSQEHNLQHDPENKSCVTLLDRPFTKNACLTVIQECVRNLSILDRTYGSQVEQAKIEPFVYQTVYERFGQLRPDYDSYRIGATYTNMHKIQKIVKELINLFEDIYHEINIFGGVSCLITYIQDYYSMSIEEKQFLVNLEEKKHIFKKLQRDLKFDKNTTKKFEEITDNTANTTTELKDFQEYAAAKINYTKKWELSRQEQNRLVLEGKETGYKSVLDGMRYKMELEDLIHDHIEKFYEEMKDEHQDGIETWMENYDKEIDQKDLDILTIKQETDKLLEKKEELEKLYEKRTMEIENYLEQKRLRKIQLFRERMENKAAIKIQTWWRNVMFEKKLGPYRPKKKGKKSDKKKKTK